MAITRLNSGAITRLDYNDIQSSNRHQNFPASVSSSRSASPAPIAKRASGEKNHAAVFQMIDGDLRCTDLEPNDPLAYSMHYLPRTPATPKPQSACVSIAAQIIKNYVTYPHETDRSGSSPQAAKPGSNMVRDRTPDAGFAQHGDPSWWTTAIKPEHEW